MENIFKNKPNAGNKKAAYLKSLAQMEEIKKLQQAHQRRQIEDNLIDCADGTRIRKLYNLWQAIHAQAARFYLPKAAVKKDIRYETTPEGEPRRIVQNQILNASYKLPDKVAYELALADLRFKLNLSKYEDEILQIVRAHKLRNMTIKPDSQKANRVIICDTALDVIRHL